MIVMRCTRKLAGRLGWPVMRDVPKSSTRLGDWYANLLVVGRPRAILFVSEATFLSVVVPVRELVALPIRFRERLRGLLEELGLPAAAVSREVDEEGGTAVAPTASRRVVGVMNELAFHAAAEWRENPAIDLRNLELRLAEIPIGGKEWVFPASATRALLTGTETEPGAAARIRPGPLLVTDTVEPAHADSDFTPEALRRWEAIPGSVRFKILNNVWCARCLRGVGFGRFAGRVERGDVVLEGTCLRCGGRVVRVVEND